MKESHCAWCGSKVERKAHKETPFCPECHETYESETQRSLHPMEERRPHND